MSRRRTAASDPARSCSAWGAAFLLLVGCGGARESGTAVERDSAGIAIVQNVAVDSAGAVWWRLEGPEVDIGGEAAEGASALFRVSAAARLDDGTMVVANAGSGELRFFDATGQPVRSAGGSGSGPGEFQGLSTLLVAGDSLLAYDLQLRRVSVFTLDGRFVRDFQLRAGNAIAALLGRFGDGRLVGRTTEFNAVEAGEVPEGLQRPMLHFVLFSGEGTALDTLASFPGEERILELSEQSISIRMLPFGRRPSFAVTGDALVAAPQDGPELRVVDAAGRLRRIIRTGAPRLTATPERMRARIERLAAAAPEPLQAGLRESYGKMPVPDVLPPHGPMLVDAAGVVWLADTEDPLAAPPAWTIFDPRGAAIARVRLPDRFHPFQVGTDYVLGVLRDDLDVEHLQLYRVLRID